MPTIKFEGQLEIDQQRGVIYFHSTDVSPLGGATLLRICRLPTPIPNPTTTRFHMLDVTHMHGTSWRDSIGPDPMPPTGLRCRKCGGALDSECHKSPHVEDENTYMLEEDDPAQQKYLRKKDEENDQWLDP